MYDVAVPRVDQDVGKLKVRTCRVCGCTDDKACVTVHGPCYWVEQDLCSACVVGASIDAGGELQITAKKKEARP